VLRALMRDGYEDAIAGADRPGLRRIGRRRFLIEAEPEAAPADHTLDLPDGPTRAIFLRPHGDGPARSARRRRPLSCDS